jgi:DoxX-like family/Glyoxalase/Bleomycin resistance protein/Dioxygenase superfamily
MKIKLTSVHVDDQEKALRFYTEVLGFVKKADCSASRSGVGIRHISPWRSVMVTDGRNAADVTKPRGQRSHSASAIRQADKEDDMNVTLEGSGTLSPMDLSIPRAKGIVIGFWIATALFCLQIGFTAYAQLSLPQVAEAFTHLGFPDYFRVELTWAKFLGVVLLLAPVPARIKEWAYAGFAITLGSALIAHLSVGDAPEAWGWAAGTGVLWGLSYFLWRRLEAMPASA